MKMPEERERTIVLKFEKYPLEEGMGEEWMCWIDGNVNDKAVVTGKSVPDCIREMATSVYVLDLMREKEFQKQLKNAKPV